MSQNKPGPREMALRALRETRVAQPVTVKQKPTEKPDMPKKKPAAEANTKTATVAGLLKRKNGCTSAEVKKATGWPSVSMPALAKACGLKLTKEKTDKGIRYYGSANA